MPQLSHFEVTLLNRIVPTQTLSDAKSTQIAIRNYMADDQAGIMAEHNLTEAEFRTLQSQTVKNIYQYLREKDFVGEREGGVNFLTEKGKHLRKQGSLEKYEEWRRQVRAENRVVIHTIETRGYLDQDEVNRNRKAIMMQRIKRFVLYPVLVIILLFVVGLAAHHYKLDNNIPAVKEFFDKGEKGSTSTKTDDKDDEDKEQDAPKAHKHKQ